jgi:hypothetical protein
MQGGAESGCRARPDCQSAARSALDCALRPEAIRKGHAVTRSGRASMEREA